MAKHIWIVEGRVEYESSNVLRAFEARADAETFAERCRKHEKKHKQCPGIDAPEAHWEKWNAHDDRWRKSHPACSSYDYYQVYAMKLTASKKVKSEPTL